MKFKPFIPIQISIPITIILIIYIIIFNKKNITELMIIIILFIFSLRPLIIKNNYSDNLKILFVIDNSLSMDAIDSNGNKKLDNVKNDCTNIINNFKTSYISIITFNNKAEIVIPFTNDIKTSKLILDSIETPNILYAKGSSLNTPIETIKENIKNEKIVLFYLSDGEITDNSKLESYKILRKYISDGAVISYGTKEGSNIKYFNNETSSEEYIIDQDTGKPAITKLDEKNLIKISKDLKIDYINSNNELNKKIKDIKRKSVILNKKNISNYYDIYYILTIPLLILIIIELNSFRRKML